MASELEIGIATHIKNLAKISFFIVLEFINDKCIIFCKFGRGARCACFAGGFFRVVDFIPLLLVNLPVQDQ
jgi:hypothetical protein